MKRFTLYLLLLIAFTRLSNPVNAQPVGFYNGTEGKAGSALKLALHNKINKHVDFSYNQAKYLINYSDADPANPSNVILFYSQISRSSSLYGTGAGKINREHVWAKSHGNFSGYRPMDSDALNLRPEDGQVNENRGNYDFDNVQPNGTQDAVAIGCWYSQSAYEPGPLTKGQVARILFYMATRYEGTNGEMDLELVSTLNNYPKPVFGNLKTLLEWNNQYPPSAMERQRNERIFRIQQNRNPFVDHPEFANYIWDGKTPTEPEFGNFVMTPEFPTVDDVAAISLSIVNTSALTDVKIFWGDTYNSEAHQLSMTKSGDTYSANVPFTGYKAGDMIYFKVQTTNAANVKASIHASYLLAPKVAPGQLTAIGDVQGTSTASPKVNQEVTISGRVTANFDNSFYIQTGNAKRSGINVYNTLFTGKTGDSLVITGTPAEYSDLTEITTIKSVYNFKANKIPKPIVLTASQVNEDYEGMLVQINNVTFDKPGTLIPEQNASYTATDNTGSIVVYINVYSRLVNQRFPSKAVHLVGVVSQFNGVYQILPRDINDFKDFTYTQPLSQNVSDNLVVFPNPAMDVLNIQSEEVVRSVKISNFSGQLVLNQQQEQKQIVIQSLLPGVYILEATFANGKSARAKFCKF